MEAWGNRIDYPGWPWKIERQCGVAKRTLDKES